MTDVLLLVHRSLRNTLRTPAAVIPNIAISVFFLFVFNAGLSSVAGLPGFKGSYLAFIIPVSIVSGSVGGAGTAGQEACRSGSCVFVARSMSRIASARPIEKSRVF